MSKVTAPEMILLARALDEAVKMPLYYDFTARRWYYSTSFQVSRAADLKAAERLEARGYFSHFGGGWVDGFRQPTYYMLTESGWDYLGTSPKRLAMAKAQDDMNRHILDIAKIERVNRNPDPRRIADIARLHGRDSMSAAEVVAFDLGRMHNTLENYSASLRESALTLARLEVMASDY